MRQLKTNPSFQWDIIDFNAKEKTYILRNKVTGEERTISKERYMELVKEQEGKKNGR
jgi:hypothetical protein